MALWLVRAGQHGQGEQDFLNDDRIYMHWGNIERDLSGATTRSDIREIIEEENPDWPKGKVSNGTGQVWGFVNGINTRDWIVLPSKTKAAIHFGEVKGPYVFNASQPEGRRQYRQVDWFATDIPRSNFDQDILYSFGALLTICQIQRNNAEQRVRKMAHNGWKSTGRPVILPNKNDGGDSDPNGETITDLAVVARDQIAQQIIAHFKGHDMARLVDAILRAQGYTTFVSPPGPDKGVDILAAPGPMGFGTPRLCVQVKSGDSALDRPTLDQLIGTMQNMNAEQGLLVSWGGFKSSIDKEKASQFFRVRLWDQGNLIEQLLDHYENLDENLKTELPLKRIWTVALAEDDG